MNSDLQLLGFESGSAAAAAAAVLVLCIWLAGEEQCRAPPCYTR